METRVERHEEGAEQSAVNKPADGGGLNFMRVFTKEGFHPYEEVDWEFREALISNSDGEIIFQQKNVEMPSSWSQTATNIVAAKYFHGKDGGNVRESSLKQLISRVVDTITVWGQKQNYFLSETDATIFAEELTHLLVNQKAAFNSPVWFNVGVEESPQCSACFINSVNDTMDSILELAKTEGRLFKFGSGTGTNLSPLRSSHELLSNGGTASGPVSFMKGFDAFAGVIKSGGKTRRAAKMVILNIDHPDIVEFIECKAKEEQKAWALVDAGYDSSLDGEAYASIFFQNANNSVRVTDEFMHAVETDAEWQTKVVTTGEIANTYSARHLMNLTAESAHACGDPGIQFDTSINRWNPCRNSGRINASNPCSEYMFLDDSACNLASLNLLKFVSERGEFDVEKYRHAVRVMFTAQEILVDNAGYPTTKIAENSHEFRPIGLGYANLGALLMYMGLPYDSESGRNYAATVTAIMNGQAYLTSSEIAEVQGPFKHYETNKAPFLEVMAMHRDAVKHINSEHVPENLLSGARKVWDQVLANGNRFGFRNAQATVLAPTGTIGFMMDCDTTGIEPDLALIKFKQLVGGGTMKIINRTVPSALKRLGYSESHINDIILHIEEKATIEEAPHLKSRHLPVFDCALKPSSGTRVINHMGHVKMMAAVQPFLSGAISKTVNMPEDSTPEDIADTYMKAWKLGLKAIAIYRDGSKRIQPMSAGAKDRTLGDKELAEVKRFYQPIRRRLPNERQAITHKFNIGGHEGYITVGMYEDGMPGEIFIVMAKEGSVISGVMDGFATAVSMALQYGVPLKVLVEKFTNTRFEPAGYTGSASIPYAKSILDYMFKWMALRFLGEEDQLRAGLVQTAEKAQAKDKKPALLGDVVDMRDDSPLCTDCGSMMVRNGACYKCTNCGSTSGCS